MTNICSILAGIITITAFVPYVLAILQRKAQPCKATWLIWALTDCIAAAGMYAKGALNGHIAGACIGALIVLMLALKYGRPGWTVFDRICLAGAALSLAIWRASNDPTLGILLSLSAIAVGSIPTWLSAWENPGREDMTAWSLFLLSSPFALLGIPQWTLQDAAQPIVFTVLNTVMMTILLVRPRMLINAAPK